MAGHLITLTTKPTSLRHYAAPGTLLHGVPGIAAGEPASIIALPDVPNGHGADFWLGEDQYSGVLWFTPTNPVTGSALLAIDRFPELGPAVPSYGALHVQGEHFYAANGVRWLWKGATDFRLAQRVYHGEDIRPLLDQRKQAGANILRVASMKFNNTGWEFDPRHDPGRFWSAIETTWQLAREFELWLEQTIFLDTGALGMDEGWQLPFYDQMVDRMRQYAHIVGELVNEDGHSTNNVDPQAFAQPHGVLMSHGSGLTNAPAVQPYWTHATYHAPRYAPPDARGFARYSVYAWESASGGHTPGYPKPCPFIPDEGMKPQDYGFNPDVARLMGEHCRVQNGGTFHTDINSDWWSPEIEACARAFYAAIK